jgi:uncharacterized protein DUF3379
MNCLDFRRCILANPRQPGEQERAHAAECAACADYLERQRELDARIFDALQVAPPDGLADRILVARGLRSRRWFLPIAATLLLTGSLVSLWPRSRGDALGREAIEHVAHEPQAFTTSHAVPKDALAALLSDQGVKVVRTVGDVTYSRLCPMAGRVVRHLVVRTAAGPVTLFLMPDDPDARRRAITQGDGMAALTLPAARGTISIVANSVDQALAMEESLRMS